jgi:nucleotide-binding universal stress UspA family protein
MYEEILVPTDGSEHAERGVEHGVEVAKQFGARLHVLFVTDETTYGKTPVLSSYEMFLQEVTEEAKEQLEEVVEEATEEGVETTMSVLRGKPHEEIVDYVEEHDIDLVVMGKRGAGGVNEPHVGSVTDRVLSECSVPVVPV